MMPIQAAAGSPRASVPPPPVLAPTGGLSVHHTLLGPPQLSSGSPLGCGCTTNPVKRSLRHAEKTGSYHITAYAASL